MNEFYKVKVTKVLSENEFIGDIVFGVHHMTIHDQKFKSMFTAQAREGQNMMLFIYGKDDDDFWLSKEVFIF